MSGIHGTGNSREVASSRSAGATSDISIEELAKELQELEEQWRSYRPTRTPLKEEMVAMQEKLLRLQEAAKKLGLSDYLQENIGLCAERCRILEAYTQPGVEWNVDKALAELETVSFALAHTPPPIEDEQLRLMTHFKYLEYFMEELHRENAKQPIDVEIEYWRNSVAGECAALLDLKSLPNITDEQMHLLDRFFDRGEGRSKLEVLQGQPPTPESAFQNDYALMDELAKTLPH